jgi:hypothetical protein
MLLTNGQSAGEECGRRVKEEGPRKREFDSD